jgi:hypothetical protein
LTHSTQGKIDLQPILPNQERTWQNNLASDKGYLVAKTVRMGKEQTYAFPGPIDPNGADAAEQKIILDEAVKAIAK